MTTNELDTITARQLRQILFFVRDSRMTVEELRQTLFSVEKQDAPVNIGFGMFERMMAADKARDTSAEEWLATYGETAEEHEAARAAYFAQFPDATRDLEPADDGDTNTGDDYELAAANEEALAQAALAW